MRKISGVFVASLTLVVLTLFMLAAIPAAEAQQVTVNALNTHAAESGNSLALTGQLQVKNAQLSTVSGLTVTVAGATVGLGDVAGGHTAVSSPFTITVNAATANSSTVLVPATISYSVGGHAVKVPYMITYPLH